MNEIGAKMKNRLVISIFMLFLVTLACSLPTPGAPTGQGQAPGETPQPSAPIIQLPGGTPPSQPVSISEGLASLNSYRTILSITSVGPKPQDSTTITIETQRLNDKDAQVTHLTSKAIKDGQPSQDNTDSQIYRIGNDQCSGSGESWSYESMAPNQAEMLDMVMSMFSFTPATYDPVFVTKETVNGIPSNHFSFKVKALGTKSGANVTINKGDYWLAVDGQYIVKYSLVAETVVDPKTNIFHMETTFEVKEVNQPVTITFTQACLEAAKATPSASSQNSQPAPTESSSVVPNPTQASSASAVAGFAGFWDTNFGVMTCGVDGQKVNCTYTHNSGKIEAFMNPDGVSMEGSWFEAPTYKPADHAGRVVMTLSADGNSFTGQWWHGPAGDGGTWTGTRK
jgi:hypothetical protein